ncbi:MAG: plasmid stabilization protein [Chloroflexota bacterium]|nr:plasmid stabilization protein [Chloroflexota bacterium]
MASITVRNLDDEVKRRLRVRAAEKGCSMEEEARDILKAALDREPQPSRNMADAIRARFAPLGGVEIEAPRHSSMRPPPQFD